jgi:hypothetical protein
MLPTPSKARSANVVSSLTALLAAPRQLTSAIAKARRCCRAFLILG